MGNLCSKRAAAPVSAETVLSSTTVGDSGQALSLSNRPSLAHPAYQPSRDNRLLSSTAARYAPPLKDTWLIPIMHIYNGVHYRACAKSVCSRLECIFAPVINSLDQQLAASPPSASSAALTWPALQLVQLQAFICASLSIAVTPDTISHLLAVLYTLAIAAPTAVAGTIATHSSAITRLIAALSVILSNQDSTCAAQIWSQWQQLADAVGLTPCYLPVVLIPASKAVLFQLEAAAKSAAVHTVRLQVHRLLLLYARKA